MDFYIISRMGKRLKLIKVAVCYQGAEYLVMSREWVSGLGNEG